MDRNPLNLCDFDAKIYHIPYYIIEVVMVLMRKPKHNEMGNCLLAIIALAIQTNTNNTEQKQIRKIFNIQNLHNERGKNCSDLINRMK